MVDGWTELDLDTLGSTNTGVFANTAADSPDHVANADGDQLAFRCTDIRRRGPCAVDVCCLPGLLHWAARPAGSFVPGAVRPVRRRAVPRGVCPAARPVCPEVCWCPVCCPVYCPVAPAGRSDGHPGGTKQAKMAVHYAKMRASPNCTVRYIPAPPNVALTPLITPPPTCSASASTYGLPCAK